MDLSLNFERDREQDVFSSESFTGHHGLRFRFLRAASEVNQPRETGTSDNQMQALNNYEICQAQGQPERYKEGCEYSRIANRGALEKKLSEGDGQEDDQDIVVGLMISEQPRQGGADGHLEQSCVLRAMDQHDGKDGGESQASKKSGRP